MDFSIAQAGDDDDSDNGMLVEAVLCLVSFFKILFAYLTSV